MANGNANAVFQLTQNQLNANSEIGDKLSYEFGLLNAGWRWGDGSNVDGTVTQVIKFYFVNDASSVWNDNKDEGTALAMQTWEAVANIDFQQASTANDADILLLNTTTATIAHFIGYSGTPNHASSNNPVFDNPEDTTTGLKVDVRVGGNGQVYTHFAGQDTKEFGERSPGGWYQDSRAWQTIIHEIGHALGLKHPHDSGTTGFRLFPGVSGPYSAGPDGLNTAIHTIMSYNKPQVSSPTATRGDPAFHGYSDSPMAFDIAAIQLLYGANTTYNNGDNTYFLPDPPTPVPTSAGGSWGQPGAQFECIWDTGGTDQIVYNGGVDAVINLRPATLKGVAGAGGYFSWTEGRRGHFGFGFSIAGDITNAIPNVNGVEGVIIENAIGGAGDDLLAGNDVDNFLRGREGKDTLRGYGGNDNLDGGAHKDSLSGGLGDDTYWLNDVTNGKYDTVTESAAGGTDTVVVTYLPFFGPASYTLGAQIENGNISPLGGGNGFTLIGNGKSNSLGGSDYNDTLVGGVGNDTLIGGHGYDTLKGGADNDTYYLFYVSGGPDGTGPLQYSRVIEGAFGGNDTVIVRYDAEGVSSYTLGANVENGKIFDPLGNAGMALVGNALDNKLWGGRGGDSLYGLDGNDEFYGNDDALNSGTDSDPHSYTSAWDEFYGGKGNDHYYLYETDPVSNYALIHENLDEGIDTVHVMAAHNGTILVHDYTMAENVEIGRIESSAGFILTGNASANNLYGNSGGDGLVGLGGNDTLRGLGGYDVLAGGGDGDTYYLEDVTRVSNVGPPENWIYTYDEIQESDGDLGFDIVYIKAAGRPDAPQNLWTKYTVANYIETVFVTGTDGMTIIGNNTGARIVGSTGRDNLTAGNAATTLEGGGGKDTLTGTDGYADILIGGAGQDSLTGGANNRDTFVFKSIGDSLRGVGGRDLITDFTQGNIETRDVIDLSLIDANNHANGNQAFHFIGTDQFSSDRKHHVYGELRYFQSPWSEGTNTIIEGDVNGDGKADFQIELYGPGSNGFTLSIEDFRL